MWKESNVALTFQSMSSRSLTRADENESGDTILTLAIVGVVEFRRVWDRIKTIPRNTTDKCSEYNPKIEPLTDLHTRWHSSYFSSSKRTRSTGSYKNVWLYEWMYVVKGDDTNRLQGTLNVPTTPSLFSSGRSHLLLGWFHGKEQLAVMSTILETHLTCF